ncbi:3'-5' exonuclease [Coraliomargarita parva]|uniref:3'-5' exonuclease n=1 Tax=Coraliomargarita parva TaxID=3014050 RepID=UPI0022B4B988|nr:3'-5' exonuclease [Coraliomargarita parva]
MSFPPIHVIDFEGCRQSGIVEYGVVTLAQGAIQSAETRLCRAIGAIRERDRQQHGISEADVAGEAPFSVEWARFAGYREAGPLCAHHAVVEDGFLRSVWPYPRVSPDFSEAGPPLASWGPWLDTLQIYRRIYPDLESFKLEHLIECFDLAEALQQQAGLYCPPKRGKYHCALYDALASALLLLRLFEAPGLEGLSLRWLFLQSAATDRARDEMGQQELF